MKTAIANHEKTEIGIPTKAIDTITDHLKQLLADETALSFLTRDAHWNVTGPFFGPLHQMFGTQYEFLDNTIDEVAERIRSLGRPVQGKLTELAEIFTLPEGTKTTGNAEQLLESLLEGHEFVIRQLRKAIDEITDLGDTGTADFLTGIMEAHEKTAWMLRSSIS